MENLMPISFILHLDIGIKATQALHYSFTLVWTVECYCSETTRLAVSLMPYSSLLMGEIATPSLR